MRDECIKHARAEFKLDSSMCRFQMSLWLKVTKFLPDPPSLDMSAIKKSSLIKSNPNRNNIQLKTYSTSSSAMLRLSAESFQNKHCHADADLWLRVMPQCILRAMCRDDASLNADFL